MAKRLRGLGALTGASDHGVSKSLYGRDPDGNEFEVMWEVPARGVGRVRRPGDRHAARPRGRGASLGSQRVRRFPSAARSVSRVLLRR